jgi:hypothetical protein
MSHVSDGTMTATPPRYTRRLSDKSVIVRCVHRPKRLQRKRKAAAIAGPAIVRKVKAGTGPLPQGPPPSARSRNLYPPMDTSRRSSPRPAASGRDP